MFRDSPSCSSTLQQRAVATIVPEESHLTFFLQGYSAAVLEVIHAVPSLGRRKAAQAGADLSYSDTALPAIGAKAPNSPAFSLKSRLFLAMS